MAIERIFGRLEKLPLIGEPLIERREARELTQERERRSQEVGNSLRDVMRTIAHMYDHEARNIRAHNACSIVRLAISRLNSAQHLGYKASTNMNKAEALLEEWITENLKVVKSHAELASIMSMWMYSSNDYTWVMYLGG